MNTTMRSIFPVQFTDGGQVRKTDVIVDVRNIVDRDSKQSYHIIVNNGNYHCNATYWIKSQYFCMCAYVRFHIGTLTISV